VNIFNTALVNAKKKNNHHLLVVANSERAKVHDSEESGKHMMA
jgi:hypothetical protein